ncbi:MAG: MATE family efflux transporter [bacterium]|nr:MATE family efflux transporter [bacterium]
MSRPSTTPSPVPSSGPAGGRRSAWRVHQGREILALAAPTVLTMLSQTLMWTVDTALLGRVSSLALAAAGLGGMLTWASYSLFNNLSRITGTFVSQAWGKGDEDHVGHYTWQGVWIALVSGTVLMVFGWFSYLVLPWTHNPQDVQDLTYVYIKYRSLSAVFTQLTMVLMGFFQGRRDVKVPMYAGIIGNVLNLVLDVWLIFGWSGFALFGRTWLAVPAMGVQGAAIGTSVGTFVNAVFLAAWALAPRLRAKYALHLVRRPDPRAIANMVRVGLPAAWEGFLDMSGFLMFTIFVGTAGAVQLAASQITIQVLSFSFMPLWGLTTAAAVLTGNWIGAGDPDQAAHYGRQTYKLGTYYSLALAAVLVLARHHVFKVFTNDPEVLVLGSALVVAAAIFQYFDGIRMLSSGILQGAGDTRYTMLVTLIVMWGGFIPLTWWLIVQRDGDVVVAWMGASACYLLQGIFMWRRFRSGAWRKIEIFE